MNKKSKIHLHLYLEHILTAIKRIHHYTDDLTEITFLQSELIQDAVIRNIEIIGEASRNIDRHHPYFTADHPEVPWSDLYWMRNRVSHGYFSVDLELVWKTLEKDIPKLEEQIQKLYEKIPSK
ncbi:MAG: hypothetical protein ACD_16C00100G0079 [uncultured bacterium]|nr:MAG: hypothetical protein ACD_16C00100G0079 [uncultured bacterium]OFW68056.1 MAG: hypothetical protein A2X70_05045 [Alphaproteobacteria bacterium GWC2_42_16]OFW73448.1 MAG: hypothetical protein A2Z80_06345 [Alphaproteobacteria bacterium GWA2_41_27]OFW82297.1 MAG: hypothetical protein A3E50_03745 [Alphaproteobacteria bacterium RIFCSPHIGHO2_12_FULL_42_100]OFW86123.1 MAG: hypothetical protein A2W06_00675 [Alphaproteobacteria bacterium RBG_16_42_14]OFW91682.1 MAG: hypothetical protein A3C41_007